MALLACSVFAQEIALLTREAKHIVETRWFEMGLHDNPESRSGLSSLSTCLRLDRLPPCRAHAIPPLFRHQARLTAFYFTLMTGESHNGLSKPKVIGKFMVLRLFMPRAGQAQLEISTRCFPAEKFRPSTTAIAPGGTVNSAVNPSGRRA